MLPLDAQGWIRLSELDEIGAREMAEQIGEFDAAELSPRSYPGYPTWPLPRARQRWRPALDAVLAARRTPARVSERLPSASTLGQLLESAHGITGTEFRGPTPSAGGLQALELFVVNWHGGWLPAGAYHYDRQGHHLSQIVGEASTDRWRAHIPSLGQLAGGALVWVLVGDGRRVAAKYGPRGDRFLLLEAGHLMQNLCLVSASLGLSTVPMGGCLESQVARELKLLASDRVLYAGMCGAVEAGRR